MCHNSFNGDLLTFIAWLNKKDWIYEAKIENYCEKDLKNVEKMGKTNTKLSYNKSRRDPK